MEIEHLFLVFVHTICRSTTSTEHHWSLQRQKPKLHWYQSQISFWRVWTKNKDTCIILLFSCLLHICICIYTIYISILRAVCMHRMYLVRQISDWELQLQIVLELAARSHGDFSSALERSALEKFRAETMLGRSFIAVVKARGDKPKDGISPWQQDCNIAFVWDYRISYLEWKWNMMLHRKLVISWIIQSNIRTAPMLLALWAVSSHCFHCFIGAGKTFDLQPRGSVERSEMWMVWTCLDRCQLVPNLRIEFPSFSEVRDFEAAHHVTQSLLVRLPDTRALWGWDSGMIFVGRNTTCHVFFESNGLCSLLILIREFWCFLILKAGLGVTLQDCAEFLPDCSVELVQSEPHSPTCVQGVDFRNGWAGP